MPKPPAVVCIHRSQCTPWKVGNFNLRETASPLNFAAGCAKKPMFKAKISIRLKSVYVAGNNKKEEK